MAIICIEGPSAVGKTTTSYAMAERHQAHVVDEIPPLFAIPPDLEGEALSNWFIERSVDRWKIALEHSKKSALVVLDGDHLKVWYDWVYESPATWKRDFGLLRELVAEKSIGFPDGYFLLSASEKKLRSRKEDDLTRRRRKFEKHLRLRQPQKRFFLALNSAIPGYVSEIQTADPQPPHSEIALQARNLPKVDPYSLELFDFMGNWMENNPP